MYTEHEYQLIQTAVSPILFGHHPPPSPHPISFGNVDGARYVPPLKFGHSFLSFILSSVSLALSLFSESFGGNPSSVPLPFSCFLLISPPLLFTPYLCLLLKIFLLLSEVSFQSEFDRYCVNRNLCNICIQAYKTNIIKNYEKIVVILKLLRN